MHVDDGLDHLGGEVVERLVTQDAGVVDDDVDGAERVDRGLDDSLAAVSGGHRVGVGHGLATEIDDLLGDPLGRSGVATLAADGTAEVVDHEPGAASGELERMFTAEAAAGAGDDRDLAVESDVSHGGPPRAQRRRDESDGTGEA